MPDQIDIGVIDRIIAVDRPTAFFVTVHTQLRERVRAMTLRSYAGSSRLVTDSRWDETPASRNLCAGAPNCAAEFWGSRPPQSAESRFPAGDR